MNKTDIVANDWYWSFFFVFEFICSFKVCCAIEISHFGNNLKGKCKIAEDIEKHKIIHFWFSFHNSIDYSIEIQGNDNVESIYTILLWVTIYPQHFLDQDNNGFFIFVYLATDLIFSLEVPEADDYIAHRWTDNKEFIDDNSKWLEVGIFHEHPKYARKGQVCEWVKKNASVIGGSGSLFVLHHQIIIGSIGGGEANEVKEAIGDVGGGHADHNVVYHKVHADKLP